jgi:guanine nucleotide exchange factor VAV
MANELWRECAAWLTRCGLLRPDHKANWAEATLTDLAYTLRDGVLLCNFINTLDPNSIDMKDVNQKPQFAQVMLYFRIYTSVEFNCIPVDNNDPTLS